jgi:hypothetical protein
VLRERNTGCRNIAVFYAAQQLKDRDERDIASSFSFSSFSDDIPGVMKFLSGDNAASKITQRV